MRPMRPVTSVEYSTLIEINHICIASHFQALLRHMSAEIHFDVQKDSVLPNPIYELSGVIGVWRVIVSSFTTYTRQRRKKDHISRAKNN
jgi:hypothetical protein